MEYFRPAAFIITPYIGSFPSSRITRRAIKEWYEKDLKLPSWRPPNLLFPPVWTTLYGCMGYASYLVWRDGGGFHGDGQKALAMYGTQLALNWAWTPIFFGKKKIGAGLADILLLWGGVAGCIYLFRPINETASNLMIPYLAWVSFASCLNFWIWRNNPAETKKSD